MWNPVSHVLEQFKPIRSEDFPGVVVPLAQAQRHHSVSEKAEKHDEKNASEDDEAGVGARSLSVSNMTTVEGLKAQLDQDATSFGLSSVYDRKSKLINLAIQDMGMGRYQWSLFVLCGFGWFADNFWLQGVALTLTPIANEFSLTETEVRFTTLALFVGLTLGASFWGIMADIIGRRLAFNTTLFLAAVFGMAAAGPDTWIGVCALYACLGLGVGGNLPVDGALFLEFLPFASGALLTGLSVWWPVGSLVVSLIAWGIIVNYSCDPTIEVCTRANNFGWRYFLIILGAITFLQWICRFLLFHLYESPKYLLSRGRQREAVAVVHAVAYANGKQTWLTEDLMNELGGAEVKDEITKLSTIEIIKHSLSKFSIERFKPLFQERKIALTTVLLWFIWATIGMGYPLFNAFLPQYIGQNGASTYTVYRNYAITNVVGVPGSIIAIWTVDLPYIGRRGTMGFATAVTGVFVCLFTVSKNSNFQLAMTCLESFFQNIMYGVLYAYTPEVFPAPNRGTGTGIASTFNRIAGVCAPLVGIYGGQANPVAPIYAAAGLFFAAFISMIFLPIETRGRQSL